MADDENIIHGFAERLNIIFPGIKPGGKGRQFNTGKSLFAFNNVSNVGKRVVCKISVQFYVAVIINVYAAAFKRDMAFCRHGFSRCCAGTACTHNGKHHCCGKY